MSGAPPVAAALSQALPSLLMLGFATLSLAVARHTPPPLAAEGHRAAWRLTGAAFLVTGAHALAATVARWAGTVLPGGDAGRAPVLLLYAAALLLLVWRGDTRLWRGGAAVWAALTLALVPGLTAPWWLPRLFLSPSVQAVAAGTAEAATVVVLLAALLTALLRDAVDRLLWGALALFALRAAGGAWLPLLPWTARPSSAATALTAVTVGAMVALAARRLALARRGTRVPSLMEPLWPHRMRPAR